ncbi:hypothetical protein [Microvirga calopogonii]|uniref:hypothetical protein n=1 Tax=Microvirga calopogonii TaxID=2078013 RepID=UPI000E0D7759|nr:hypothetical protein [Microvirga calopogonii]
MQNLAPQTPENLRDFPARGRGATVSIQVASGLTGRLKEGPQIFEIERDTKLDMLIMVLAEIRARFQVVRKGTEHGLSRYGPRPVDDYLIMRRAQDYFTSGEDVAKSADILFCDALEVKGCDEDPSAYRVPHCEQLSFSPDLNASVRLHYRRVYFSMWREIKEKTEALLRTFLQPAKD